MTQSTPAPGSDHVVPPPPTPFNFAAHLVERNVGRGERAAYVDDDGTLTYAAPAATGADDPGFWLYSSGSTGRPRARCTSTPT
jgi:hypothetical protein